MAKMGKGKDLGALVAAGTWVWANRDRIRDALQSEPVQQALKSAQAQRLLAHPKVRQVLESPQVRGALHSPEVQQWLSGGPAGAQPQAQPPAPAQGEYEPYTGETRRLG